MLFAESSWELTDDIDIIRSLTKRPELRRYQSFELGLNVPLYHINAIVDNHLEDRDSLRRLKFTNLMVAVQMVKKSGFKFVEILQEPEFSLKGRSTLREILSVWTGPGYPSHYDVLIETAVGNFKVSLNSTCAYEDFSDSGYQKIWSKS